MTKQYTLERASPRSSIAMFDTATDIYAPRRLRKNNGRQLKRTRKENTCRQHDKYVSRWRCIECIKYEEFFFFFFSLPFPLSHPPIQLEQCFSCLNYDPSRGLPTSSTHVANVNITKRRSKRSQTFAVLNFKSDFSKNVSDSNTLRIHPGIRADCSFFFFLMRRENSIRENGTSARSLFLNIAYLFDLPISRWLNVYTYAHVCANISIRCVPARHSICYQPLFQLRAYSPNVARSKHGKRTRRDAFLLLFERNIVWDNDFDDIIGW